MATHDARDFVLAEYQTVRQEWLESRSAQQHTFSWTLATVAAVLAAAMASDARTEQPFLYLVAASFIIAASTAAQAIWFGEVTRMERAAFYLRGLEHDIAAHGPRWGRRPPLQFERFRGLAPESDDVDWIPKSNTLIVGAFGMYGVLACLGGAMLIDLATASAHHYNNHEPLAIAAVCTFGVVYLASTIFLCLLALEIRTIASKIPDLAGR